MFTTFIFITHLFTRYTRGRSIHYHLIKHHFKLI
jgi:hypothetical protein